MTSFPSVVESPVTLGREGINNGIKIITWILTKLQKLSI